MKLINKLLKPIKLDKMTKYILLPVFITVFLLYSWVIGFTFGQRKVFDYFIVIGLCLVLPLMIAYMSTFLFDFIKKIPSHVIFYILTVAGMMIFMFDSGKAEVANVIVVIALPLCVGLIGYTVFRMVNKVKLKWYVNVLQVLLMIASAGVVCLVFIYDGPSNELEVNAFETYKTDHVVYENEEIYDIVSGVYGNADYLDKYDDKDGFESTTTSISHFLGSWSWSREKYLGFNVFSVPLNAHYYMPKEDGAYPLVLVVHGNHEMSHDSEIGYEYLGNYLASRGYIVVSVDENFLNYSHLNSGLLQSSLGNENDARAYVLLEHADYLLKESFKSDSVFSDKLDGEVALIGHSRGGEAVSVAAFFNQVNYLPNNYRKKFSYDFDIDTVIAIAPTDKQYKPGGRGTELKDIDYLLLHGTHDMDVSYLTGLNQYERIHNESSDHFKSVVNIYGANHGYFNQTWSAADTMPFGGRLYNTGQLIERNTQEIIASQLIYNFLEASIKKDDNYKKGFENLSAFVDLPKGLYQSQYHDGKDVIVLDYNEDNYLETGRLATVEGLGLSKWYEGQSAMDSKTSEVFGAYLGWNQSGQYIVTLSETLDLSLEDDLFLTLADNTKDEDDLIDFEILLKDMYGQSATLALSTYGYLQPRIDIDIPKVPFIEDNKNHELMMQTYQLSLEDFINVNSDLDVSNLTSITLKFGLTDDKVIFLKDLGFRLQN